MELQAEPEPDALTHISALDEHVWLAGAEDGVALVTSTPPPQPAMEMQAHANAPTAGQVAIRVKTQSECGY